MIYSQINSIIDDYKGFFDYFLENAIEVFKREYQSRKNSQLPSNQEPKKITNNNKGKVTDFNLTNEYLKQSLARLERETNFPFSSIEAIGKRLKKDVFEIVKPQYLVSQVAKMLNISRNIVMRITEEADMFKSGFLVNRLGRLKEKDKLNKSETSVFYSVLGILYLAYWSKYKTNLESFYILNNKKIREDVIAGVLAHERGEMDLYSVEDAIQKLGLSG